MVSKIIFKYAFWSLVITGILNWIAHIFNLYENMARVDTLVHFFGGLTAALGILWISAIKFDLEKWSAARLFWITLIVTFLIGILWELFELYFGITWLSDGTAYVTDTTLDLIMDSLGAVVGFLMIKRLLKSLSL